MSAGCWIVRDSMALVDLLAQRRGEPRRPLLHCEGRTWTGAELAARADACAAVLAAAGVRRGDHVALLLENSADFVALFFGVARLGAVAVTINSALRGEGLGYVLAHSDVRILVVEADLADVAANAAHGCRRLEAIWRRGDELEGLLDRRPAPSEPPVDRGPGEVAAILYTSGTTGRAKGVMLTDAGYKHAAEWFVRSLRLGQNDILHTCLPLFHVNAQQLSLCGALVAGAELVLERRFSAGAFWDSIAAHGVTSFNLIGAMLGILHAQVPHPRERAHRARVACVAPVPVSIHRECEERFGVMLLDGYGLTETTPGITYNPYGDAREGSCGKPAPYVELRIADADGTPLPPQTPGEILVRFREPNIFMAGYYKSPAATASAMRDGWFRTGDWGHLDEDGYLYFLGRIKDVIRRRGENISPAEIERAALSHPGIAEAAAVGVLSDLVGGEDDVALFVLPRAGATIDPKELVATCEEQLASFMVPRYVGVLGSFPRTETQRVRKVALRERGVAGCFDRERERAVRRSSS